MCFLQDLQDALRRVEEMARQGEEAQKANQVLFQEAKQQIRRMQDSRRRVRQLGSSFTGAALS